MNLRRLVGVLFAAIFSTSAHAGATLAISSASLDTTGAVLTLNISGVSGSLTPATGITGITAHGTIPAASTVFPSASATASGSVVTVTLDSPIRSGATLTVDLPTTSNLRDTAGDTPTGQSGFSGTNGSTFVYTDFAIPNSNVVITGTLTDNGTSFTEPAGSTVSFNATGSYAAMVTLGGAWSITIDGGTPLNFLPGECGYTSIPLFSGLADTTHSVVLAQGTGPGCGAFVLWKSPSISVHGAAPALSPPVAPPSSANSTIVASPTSTAAGSPIGLTVTVRDANNNLLSGVAVALTASGSANTFTPASGTTNASGVFTATISSTIVQTETVTATEGAAQESTSVTFVPGAPSAAKSTLTANPTSVAALGTIGLTVTLADAFGNVVPNAAVTFSGSGIGNTFTPPSGTTNASGVLTSSLTSNAIQAETITASEGSVQETVSVTFTAPAGGGSSDLVCGGINDTAVVQAAANLANGTIGAATVPFPVGKCVTSTITAYSNTQFVGHGKGISTWQLLAGTNGPLLQSSGFAALTGTNSTAGVGNLMIEKLTLDGNAANNTGTAPVVQFYGWAPTLEHVEIRNGVGDGLYTEWSSSSGCPTNSPGDMCMEAHVIDFVAHDNGANGWNDKGPHDSQVTQMITYYNNKANVGAAGFVNAGGSIQLDNIHSWGFTQKYALNLVAPAQITNWVAEGAAVAGGAQVLVGYPETQLVGGMTFGCAAGIPGVQIGTAASQVFYSTLIGVEADQNCGFAFTNDTGGDQMVVRVTTPNPNAITGTVPYGSSDLWVQHAPFPDGFFNVGAYTGAEIQVTNGFSWPFKISTNSASVASFTNGGVAQLTLNAAGALSFAALLNCANGIVTNATGALSCHP